MAHLLGIAPYLDAISDPYTVVNGKPAPDTFLWAAGALGVNPKRCVVFEDASAGVQAALAGGFHVVGLGDPALVGNAHLVYRIFSMPPLASLNLSLRAIHDLPTAHRHYHKL
jgi:beta-phosphoglucomutase-like phosphatase (HAD superfamily)